jgi:hypothetical protein
MKSEPKYREGTEVRQEFERALTALFRAPKPKDRKQLKATIERKSEKTRQTARKRFEVEQTQDRSARTLVRDERPAF